MARNPKFDTGRWRVDDIFDTRVYDWETCKPDPTTGDPVECECCGREIVVHAHVRNLENNDRAVIGTECCKQLRLRNHAYDCGNRNYWRRSKPYRFPASWRKGN